MHLNELTSWCVFWENHKELSNRTFTFNRLDIWFQEYAGELKCWKLYSPYVGSLLRKQYVKLTKHFVNWGWVNQLTMSKDFNCFLKYFLSTLVKMFGTKLVRVFQKLIKFQISFTMLENVECCYNTQQRPGVWWGNGY